MLVSVELPSADETFQFDLEDSATILELKSELEEETDVRLTGEDFVKVW